MSTNPVYEKICAHRGYGFPENSLLAFRRAVEHNVGWIEFDVHLTQDDEFIVWHDSTLKKLGKIASVSSFSSKELKKYDIGEGERMPLLREVLEEFNEKIGLNIELKTKNAGRNLSDYLTSFDKKKQWMISSFHLEALKELKKQEVDADLGYLYLLPFSDHVKIASKFNLTSINPFYMLLSERRVRNAHAKGIKVIPWTVNKEKALRKMVKINADIIITDQVKLAKNILLQSMTIK